MITHPIIPIGVMAGICVALLILKRRGVFPYIRQIIMIALLFMINLRITIPNGIQEIQTQQMDAYVLFVIDDTISMLAEDYDGNGRRLDAVKEDCSYIVDELNGAKFSVVYFHNKAQLLSPYTDDPSFIKSAIRSITPLQELYAKGTTLNICKDQMLEMLETAQERDNGDVIVFFISDGEITSGGQLESFKEMREYVDNGAVLGYGTNEGGNMHMLNYYDEYELIMDETDWSNYKPAVSCIDEKNLKSIASDLNVEYIHMTSQGKIDSVLEEIKESVTSDTIEKVEEGYDETYFWFAIPLALMLVFEFVAFKKKK